MNDMNETNDGAFVIQLRIRAEEKAKEYGELLHEKRRIEMQLERTKNYVAQLNAFLEAEGRRPVIIREERPGSTVGKPGNRSKEMPLRKSEWELLAMNDIIAIILNQSPTVVYHPKQVAPLIYEIQSDADLRMVERNVRSTMQRGAREGRWDRVGRAKFKAKATVQQGKLVHA